MALFLTPDLTGGGSVHRETFATLGVTGLRIHEVAHVGTPEPDGDGRAPHGVGAGSACGGSHQAGGGRRCGGRESEAHEEAEAAAEASTGEEQRLLG